MLRIVAGRYRGRRLLGPRGAWLRPTGERIKESIYNVLQGWVEGARVLDLCAGTGNLGLEALSRGAAAVVLVDSSRRARDLIGRNLERLGAGGAVQVVGADAVRYLQAVTAGSFDLVLADPPYDAGLEAPLLAAVPGALPACFVLQHRKSFRMGPPPPGFRALASKRFGDTVVDFLVREEAADDGFLEPRGAVPRDV
jgi:16S rRNA (guanine966-N2)-methyltransferase